MLGHIQTDLRQVEHLTDLDRGHRSPAQAAATPAASRRVTHHPIRIRDLAQRRSLVPRLPTRTPLAPLAPRPRRRFAVPLAARWLIGVPRALPHPALQLRHPLQYHTQLRSQRRVLLGQHHDRAVPLGQLRPQLAELAAQRTLDCRSLCQRRPPRGKSRSPTPGTVPTTPTSAISWPRSSRRADHTRKTC